MQIIIEGYQYPAGAVDRVLWEGAFQTVDGKVSIGAIDVPKLLTENVADPQHPHAPIYLPAQDVLEYIS